MDQIDVLIIGGGPGGCAAAIALARAGRSVTVIDAEATPGGTSAHRGGVPAQSLAVMIQTLAEAREALRSGWLTAEQLDLDLHAAQRRLSRVTQQMAGELRFELKQAGVTWRQGHGRLTGPGQIQLTPGEGEPETLSAAQVILAPGARPRALPDLPFDDHVLDAGALLRLTETPRHLVIAGGGLAGVQSAHLFADLGVRTTLVHRGERLLPGFEAALAEDMHRLLVRRGVKVHLGAELTEAARTEQGVKARVAPTDGRKATGLSGSHLLVAIGRVPHLADLGLEAAGVEATESGTAAGIKAPNFTTTAPEHYALGDALAGDRWPAQTHVARAQGEALAARLLGQPWPPLQPHHMPRCLYGRPEIACVGLTEAEARSAGHEVRVGEATYAATGRGRAIGGPPGRVRVIADAEMGELLGVHLMGPMASEQIAEAVTLLRLEATLDELATSLHPHPALGQALARAARAA